MGKENTTPGIEVSSYARYSKRLREVVFPFMRDFIRSPEGGRGLTYGEDVIIVHWPIVAALHRHGFLSLSGSIWREGENEKPGWKHLQERTGSTGIKSYFRDNLYVVGAENPKQAGQMEIEGLAVMLAATTSPDYKGNTYEFWRMSQAWSEYEGFSFLSEHDFRGYPLPQLKDQNP